MITNARISIIDGLLHVDFFRFSLRPGEIKPPIKLAMRLRDADKTLAAYLGERSGTGDVELIDPDAEPPPVPLEFDGCKVPRILVEPPTWQVSGELIYLLYRSESDFIELVVPRHVLCSMISQYIHQRSRLDERGFNIVAFMPRGHHAAVSS